MYSNKNKGEQILNLDNINEKSFFEGYKTTEDGIKIKVAYLFKDGNKLKQNDRLFSIDDFLKKYVPSKNKTTAEKIQKNAKDIEKSDSRLMYDYSRDDYNKISEYFDKTIPSYKEKLNELQSKAKFETVTDIKTTLKSLTSDNISEVSQTIAKQFP
jgi:hypothetical protein